MPKYRLTVDPGAEGPFDTGRPRRSDPRWPGRAGQGRREGERHCLLLPRDAGRDQRAAGGERHVSAKFHGHATQIDQLASDILGVAMSAYDYQTAGIAKTGTQVTYEPLIGPVVQRPNGAALLNSAPHPAAAYLFYTWILTDGQEVLREAGLRSSLQEEAESGTQDVETIRRHRSTRRGV